MPMNRIRVDPIDRHPEYVTILADAFAAEWPEWASTVSRDEMVAGFAPGLPQGLPAVLVAHDGGRPLGTIALRPWFAEEPMEHSPWVRGLLVLPGHRGGAVFPALEAAVEDEARLRGFEYLHAATNRIERLLARRGWETFERIEHQGEPMAWMRKRLRTNRR
jgi:GNAT superfamily N-acetyltransferase